MATKIDSSDLRSFQSYLVQCKNVVILIGSGLSVNSGLETYQNSSGFWKNFHSIDLATPDAFIENPGLVWQFYAWRRSKALKAKPNKGHFALAEFSKRFNKENDKNCLSINQNVDGLNTRAGHDDENILELHGSLFTLKCTDFFCDFKENNNFKNPLTKQLLVKDSITNEITINNKKRRIDSDKDQSVELNLTKDELPKCPKCGGLLRPGVVWFGESISLKTINTIDDFFLNHKIDLILVIGSSGRIWPAVGYVERVKLQGGKIAIFNTEINFDEVKKDKNICWGFQGDAAETLELALEPVIGKKYLPRDYRKR